MTFVEFRREALDTLQANRLAANVEMSQCTIAPFRAEDWVIRQRQAGNRFDVLMFDPPFPWPWPEGWLTELADLVAPNGILLVRRHYKTEKPLIPPMMKLEREIRYGDSLVFWYVRGEVKPPTITSQP